MRIELDRDGFTVLRGLDRSSYEAALATLGAIIQRERVALRSGAHTYLAQPGRVPFHTDHPAARWVAWWCESQDDGDGANLLLDARPVLSRLTSRRRDVLRRAELECPPVNGGPPTLRFPVLSAHDADEHLFCSPWLRAASGNLVHQSAIDALRDELKSEAFAHTRSVRLQPGDALIIDNGRVLHGRDRIGEASSRVLHRCWVHA